MPFGTRCFNMLPLVSRDLSATLCVCMYTFYILGTKFRFFEDVAAVGTCIKNRVSKFWYIFKEVWWY